MFSNRYSFSASSTSGTLENGWRRVDKRRSERACLTRLRFGMESRLKNINLRSQVKSQKQKHRQGGDIDRRDRQWWGSLFQLLSIYPSLLRETTSPEAALPRLRHELCGVERIQESLSFRHGRVFTENTELSSAAAQ
jgi:hypothetical protein